MALIYFFGGFILFFSFIFYCFLSFLEHLLDWPFGSFCGSFTKLQLYNYCLQIIDSETSLNYCIIGFDTLRYKFALSYIVLVYLLYYQLFILRYKFALNYIFLVLAWPGAGWSWFRGWPGGAVEVNSVLRLGAGLSTSSGSSLAFYAWPSIFHLLDLCCGSN